MVATGGSTVFKMLSRSWVREDERPSSLEAQGLLAGMMRYFRAKVQISLARKYRSVPASSPWVSEDERPWERGCMFPSHQNLTFGFYHPTEYLRNQKSLP